MSSLLVKSGARLSRRAFLALLGAAALARGPFTASAYPIGRASETEWHERMQPLMGTYVAIAIEHRDRATALGLIGRCFEHIIEKIAQLSSWDEGSLVSQLNRERVLGREEATGELALLLDVAERVRTSSGGAFNLLINPLTAVWREAAAAGVRPRRSEIASIVRDLRRGEVRVAADRLSIIGFGAIDVGGIGKGLVADLACSFLHRQGVKAARVACSGDLRFLGPGPWKVDLRDPSGEGILTSLTVHGQFGISTSGISETKWEQGGETYHHLIDSRTGEPARVNRQVTVVAPTGILSDSLASSLFLIEPARMSSALRSFHGSYYLAVDAAGNLHEGGEKSVIG